MTHGSNDTPMDSATSAPLDHQLPMTLGDQLRRDPRLAEAQRLLLQVLDDYSGRLDGPRDAIPELAGPYREQLQRLAKARGGATYFPYLASGLGHGPWVELADGSVKLDFISGIGVYGLGHSHPRLLAASLQAALEDTVMQGNLQHNRGSLLMCERLLGLAAGPDADLGHCLLTTSGAMANENALKIALHHRQPADRIIALDNCFAGRTLALAQLTDRPAYRAGLPRSLTVDYLPMIDPADPDQSGRRALERLSQLVTRYPGQHAAIWLELVAGEGGYYPGSEAFFRPLLELCRQHSVVVIFDEVQTFGRLSRPFAFQHFGLDRFADVVTVGKITQVCATLYRPELSPKGPLLSQTFTGSTASIAAGLATLDELESRGCFGPEGWNMRRHDHYVQRMEELARRFPGRVSGPYGAGMMFALTPGDGSDQAAQQLVMRLYALGLMGFIAGHDPARVRFLPPPGITTESAIDIACELIAQAVAS